MALVCSTLIKMYSSVPRQPPGMSSHVASYHGLSAWHLRNGTGCSCAQVPSLAQQEMLEAGG